MDELNGVIEDFLEVALSFRVRRLNEDILRDENFDCIALYLLSPGFTAQLASTVLLGLISSMSLSRRRRRDR